MQWNKNVCCCFEWLISLVWPESVSLLKAFLPSQSFLVQMACSPFAKAKFNDPAKQKCPVSSSSKRSLLLLTLLWYSPLYVLNYITAIPVFVLFLPLEISLLQGNNY